MAQSSIPVKDSEGKVVGNQIFVAGDNVNFEFYEEGKKEPVILIDSKSGGLIIDNSNHEYDAISTEEFIEIPVKDVTIDGKNNVTFTANVADDARTFTIGPNYVSQKVGKEEKVVASVKTPFQVALPNNLPELISENKVEVKKLPVNIFDTLKDVGYESFELPDKNLMLLKSADGKLMSVSGNYIKPCGEINYYNSADSSILAISDPTKPGAAAGKSTSVLGYKLTEEELAEIGKFVEGRDLTSKDYKKIKGKDMPVDFVEPKRIGKGVTKDLHEEEVVDNKPEGVTDGKEVPKSEEVVDEIETPKDASPSPEAVADATPVDDDKKDGDGNPDGDKPNGATSLDEAPKGDVAENKDSDKPTDGDKGDKKDEGKKDGDKEEKKDESKKEIPKLSPAEIQAQKEANEKRLFAIAKGIQVVSLFIFAGIFVPAALGAAIPFAMGLMLPLLAVIAVGLISPDLTKGLVKLVAGFEQLFTGKDSVQNKIKEAVTSKNNVKSLTYKEQAKLAKLEAKLSNGKTLSKPELEKYTMLNQRKQFNLSNYEWKSKIGDSVLYEPFVNIQGLVQKQEANFITDRQKKVDAISKDIKNCDKLLSGKAKDLNGNPIVLDPNQTARLQQYKSQLLIYRSQVAGIDNPDFAKNNAIIKDMTENVRSNEWATVTAKDVGKSTFDKTFDDILSKSEKGELPENKRIAVPKLNDADVSSMLNNLKDEKSNTKDNGTEKDTDKDADKGTEIDSIMS